MTKFHDYIDKRNKKREKIDFGCLICCGKRKGNSKFCRKHGDRYRVKEA